MSGYISRFLCYISKLFAGEKDNSRQLIVEGTQSKYLTPLRPPYRPATNKSRNSDVSVKKTSNYQKSQPSRLPKNFPLIRHPSPISRSGPVDDKTFRRTDSLKIPRCIRSRGPSHICENSVRNSDECGPRLNSYPKSKSRRLYKSCPIVQCPSQTSLLRFNSADHMPFDSLSSVRNRRSGSRCPVQSNELFEFSYHPEKIKVNAPLNESMPDSRCLSDKEHGDSTSDIEFFSVAGDLLDSTAAKSSPDRYEAYETPFDNKRVLYQKNNPLFTSGCSCSLRYICNSKIPIRNHGKCKALEMSKCPQRHRGRHTLTSTKNSVDDSQENEDTSDNAMKSVDIGNWAHYRNDTSTKFERLFKSLSKKKHVIGNVIDSTSHAQWMQLSGIRVDKDANLFKQFAGGKVVLNFGEYKFLIQKMCSVHDLDYWDVLRKMATFQDEEQLPHDALLVPQ